MHTRVTSALKYFTAKKYIKAMVLSSTISLSLFAKEELKNGLNLDVMSASL